MDRTDIEESDEEQNMSREKSPPRALLTRLIKQEVNEVKIGGAQGHEFMEKLSLNDINAAVIKQEEDVEGIAEAFELS